MALDDEVDSLESVDFTANPKQPLLCAMSAPFISLLITDPDFHLPHIEAHLATCEGCAKRFAGLLRSN